MINRWCYGASVAVRSLTRRDCLKLVLAANAAWVGSFLFGPWAHRLLSMPQLGSGVPIDGLGLSIRFTSLLRADGITTVGEMVEVVAGNHEGLPIRSTREGYSALDFLREPDVLWDVRAKLEVFRESGPVSFATLTRLETEVLDLIAEGRSNRDISRQLGMNPSSVRAQLRNILSKLQGRCAPYTA